MRNEARLVLLSPDGRVQNRDYSTSWYNGGVKKKQTEELSSIHRLRMKARFNSSSGFVDSCRFSKRILMLRWSYSHCKSVKYYVSLRFFWEMRLDVYLAQIWLKYKKKIKLSPFHIWSRRQLEQHIVHTSIVTVIWANKAVAASLRNDSVCGVLWRNVTWIWKMTFHVPYPKNNKLDGEIISQPTRLFLPLSLLLSHHSFSFIFCPPYLSL